ncbi:hypothetical protein ACFL0H_14155 [Thermodesulfobacteriota bacterium]
MRRLSVLVVAMIVLIGMSVSVWAQPKARPGESWVPVEMAVFKPPHGPQEPGTHLNAPGDTYRYTYILDNKYAKDPSYVVSRASIGVHILDPEYSKTSGDGAKEWGRILLDGKALVWTIGPPQKKAGYRKNDTPGPTDLVEMKSDPECGGTPPYIFNVTDLLRDNKLVLEVTNLRKDGSIDGGAPYGDFTVLRAGLHVFYKKK